MRCERYWETGGDFAHRCGGDFGHRLPHVCYLCDAELGIATSPMSERHLQEAVVEMARLLGWMDYHTFDSRRSQPGFPDLTLIHEGGPGVPHRIIVAELKSHVGRLTGDQIRWLRAFRNIIGPDQVLVYRPGDWLAGIIETDLRTGVPPT